MKISNSLKSELLRSLPSLMPAVRVGRTATGVSVRQRGADVVLDVRTPTGRHRHLYLTVQEQPVPSRVRESLRRLRAVLGARRSDYPMLASSFVSPRVRQICREEGVGYVDLAGNCWLVFDDLYVEKSVERNPFPKRGRPASLFGPVSSRLVRALLEEPGRTWKLIELVQATGMSLGQASNVTRRLLEEGYATHAARRLRLEQPAQLLEAWQADYSLAQHRRMAYYSFEQDPARLMARLAEVASAQGLRYAVTSFAGAWLVAPFVHGVSTVQWYIEEADTARWVVALDLRPVEGGPNALMLIPRDAGVFYRARAVNEVTVVGNIQLYLDLVNDPARGREQAEFLRKEHIGF